MRLSQPMDASQVWASLDQLPPADSGYLVISPNSDTEEVIYYTAKGAGRIQLATSPAARTNADGFGRGLEGTMSQPHDTNAPVEDYTPSEEDLTITYKGVTINLSTSPKLKLSLPEKPKLTGIN